MTKDKWAEILEEEVMKYENDQMKLSDPSNWAEEKRKLVNLIQTMDRATEIYNLENNIKG